MADLIDDVQKRLQHIKAVAAIQTHKECIEYLNSRIRALEEDIDVFGAVANDLEQLAAIKRLRGEYVPRGAHSK